VVQERQHWEETGGIGGEKRGADFLDRSRREEKRYPVKAARSHSYGHTRET
jgi:hypothetical protein